MIKVWSKLYPPASAMDPHSHELPRLCYILRGDFEEVIGSGRHMRRRGMVLFRPADVHHSEQFGRAGATCGLLTPPADWLALAAEFGLGLRASHHAEGKEALRLTEIFEHERSITDSFSSLSLQAVLWETIALFGRQAREATSGASIWAVRALEMLHDHSRESVSLSHVAESLGVHCGHLARTFRAAYGETLGARLRRIRAQRAAALIRGTDIPLIEVASQCGFTHQAHMTRLFRAAFGVTPGHYRRQTR
jgi:AraC family transcriptional regulator